MINYRVKDLDAMLAQLRDAGATVDEKIQDTDYGRSLGYRSGRKPFRVVAAEDVDRPLQQRPPQIISATVK